MICRHDGHPGALVESLTNLRGVVGAARLAGKTLVLFVATSLIVVTIGIVPGTLTNPGHGARPVIRPPLWAR